MKIIVVVLALAMALAGCGTAPPRDAPWVTLELQKPAPATVQVLKFAPAPSQTALLSASQSAKDPSAYSSLRPFRKFAKDTGDGVAKHYEDRGKKGFANLFRLDERHAKKEMRISCSLLIQQMREAHPSLPAFEGCSGAADIIEHSADFIVAPCKDEMFLRDNWLTVVSRDGSAFGAWHRKCLPQERVLVYKGEVVASTKCANVAIPVVKAPPKREASPPVATPAPVFITGTCPSGFTLIANAWSLKTLPNGLRREADGLIQAADERDGQEATRLDAYKPDDFSRTMGGRLRSEVKIRAPITVDLPIRYLDSKTGKIVRELGVVHLVRGVGSFHFSDDPRAYIVETVWPSNFVSPARSGGERRLRLFGYEWKVCGMNVHGAESALSP